eukprot:1567522-Rhodomonas_salina.3
MFPPWGDASMILVLLDKYGARLWQAGPRGGNLSCFILALVFAGAPPAHICPAFLEQLNQQGARGIQYILPEKLRKLGQPQPGGPPQSEPPQQYTTTQHY